IWNSVMYWLAAASLSISVAVTLTDGRPVDAQVTVRTPLASSPSSAAANVTSCWVPKLAGVKVLVPVPATTVMSVSPLPAVQVTVTFAGGAAASRTPKTAVEPSGTDTEVGDTTMAWAASLSASVAVTDTVVSPVDAQLIMRAPLVLSASSAAARVTAWSAFQFAGVKVLVPVPATTVMSVSP